MKKPGCAKTGCTERQGDFLDGLVSSRATDCIVWPYKFNKKGYAVCYYGAKADVASRVICRLKHGSKPFPEAQAAHNCGNRSCVNPNHIEWKTPKQNSDDKYTHGTMPRGERIAVARFTRAEVLNIIGDTRPFREIAAHYGCPTRTIANIRSGRQWGWLTKDLPRGKRIKDVPYGEGHTNAKLTEAQVLEIYADTRAARVIAPQYGVHKNAVLNIRNGETWAWLTGARKAA